MGNFLSWNKAKKGCKLSKYIERLYMDISLQRILDLMQREGHFFILYIVFVFHNAALYIVFSALMQ